MKTEKQKMIDGEFYLASDPDLVNERTRAKQLLHRLNVTQYVTSDATREILKLLIPNAPASLYIEPPFHCDYGYNIVCGENVYFNVNCVVLDCTKVTIGSNVLFGPGVQIYTASHPLEAAARRKWEMAKPITIGDDCWIGGGAIICPGIVIGSGCVIGAGSVVTRNIPDNTLVAGNPAKTLRNLNND